MPTQTSEPIWDAERLKNPHLSSDKQRRVRDMFAAIAPAYDLNNRLWSLGIDQRWRRKAVRLSRLKPTDVVVDVACGTGDLTIAYFRELYDVETESTLKAQHAGEAPPKQDPRTLIHPKVVGIDYTTEMLPLAVRKAGGTFYAYDGVVGDAVRFLAGDAQHLPLPDACCDVVSIAFGIRNVGDSNRAYREFRRVLRPGGRVVVLEFSKPTNGLIRLGYNLYFNHVLTRLAALVARDKTGAYRYLASSVETFKPRAQMKAELEAAGFVNVETHPLTFGVAVIYVGFVAAA